MGTSIQPAPSQIRLPTQKANDVLFTDVLLVEDDKGHATFILRALKDLVGNITHVTSATEAKERFETRLFELVLCDLRLGDESGLVVVESVRSTRPNVPTIVLTSSNNIDDAVGAMQAGAVDYMVKDFSSDFTVRLRLALERTAERMKSVAREATLRAERDAFWAASHSAQDGLAILGSSGIVVFANEAFQKFCDQLSGGKCQEEHVNIIGLIGPQDESVGKSLKLHLQGIDGSSLWTSELKTREVISGEAKSVRYFELSLSSTAIADVTHGKLQGLATPSLRRSVLWVRDVTSRKDRERFQRDLLSTTTHDLKGPLGAILTSAELILDEGSLPDIKRSELLTRIASCARNSINIIDELLSVRRIQDGALVIRPRFHPVGEFLDDILLDFQSVARAKSISLTCKSIPHEMQLFADRLALSRVVNNLVGNAIKFTPENGKVELSAKEADGATMIAVSDTGQGIEAGEQHLLFQQYSRLEKHSQVEGTGLGLYVSRNIVDAHGGKIDMVSTVGKGTTFIVTIPLPDSARVP